ncbi:DNA polymerase III subunit epsilon [Parvibium lacunae]|uniref:DNA polymerase III subunit epsilon n=1 Tax=Parvibium lacunae TaxID=1888893 RepID=A0A368L1B2_9BURK|nr:DNA polymerase III subunit epsilon [Parvibium lacunae]RCS57344.1 DNA polymerase III subunit epsilon [Parvibium lacunae]
MRQIILDTETTGLDPRQGNRILEIGCVELINRQLTGNNLHFYINPERASEEGALRVHGLTEDFLSDKPKFVEIAERLRDYLAGAEIIIHNAPFDVGFLDAEFERLGWSRFNQYVGGVTDTLALAKERHPGKRNSLDALCERYGVSNEHRVLHGALLDAELLAEVYVAMTRGQHSLVIDEAATELVQSGHAQASRARRYDTAALMVLYADAEEEAAHQSWLAQVEKENKQPTLWQQLLTVPVSAAQTPVKTDTSMEQAAPAY